MCSPASVILASIVTILVSFEAILKRISVNINFRSQFQSNIPTIGSKEIKITSKLTSIVTLNTIITLAGEHVFQGLA